MSQELLAALTLCLFAPLQAIATAAASAAFAGLGWGLGNRDTTPTLPAWVLRLKRAHANLMENLPSFVGVVLIAQVMNVHDDATRIAAWTFVAARLVFTLVYGLGITRVPVRTLAFFTSLVALGVIASRIWAAF